MTIDKTYQPAAVEGRIYAAWEAAGAFRAGRPERAKAPPYCIVIPPPNVTGSLHMGHALNNTLQDILCRFERMRGKDVLWQPGTDHAGIATQAVVERQLMERQKQGSREMGREAFIERVWQWKAESGGAIIAQLKRLGASCDWSRERFTMGERGDPNDQMVRAVAKAFIDLYNEKLIYRARRLVNWDPKLRTAISDLEVQQVEIQGNLWYVKYPIEGSDGFVVVATTRPETMLGDVAVAVHPNNDQLKHLIGRTAILPLVGRRIPIIGDEYADPEKGTGAVKITPAHDRNDFDVAQRYNRTNLRTLYPINVLDAQANLSLSDPFEVEGFLSDVSPISDVKFLSTLDRQNASSMRALVIEKLLAAGFLERADTIRELDGLFRDKGRRRVVELLVDRGLIDKIEPYTHAVPHGDRSGAVIEDRLTFQWFVDAKNLGQPAMEVVCKGFTSFVPKNWEKTFFDWMENIQPWCISRQIWWGHRIPVWYGFMQGNNKGALRLTSSNTFESITKEFVTRFEDQAIADAAKYYETTAIVVVADEAEALDLINSQRNPATFKVPIWRDPDVLDTWFSSAVWPFSTLGWPNESTELKRYYPTSVLVTGFDIIFFWVARMMMMGLHFMRKERPAAPLENVVPFHDVYIHALVRDERGQKMSKSKGNVIDPLELIDDFGADALRFTLAAMASQGRDIKLSGDRVAGYRNFATKLWNAARFGEVNACAYDPKFDAANVRGAINQWIVDETKKTGREVTAAIEAYKFNEAAGAVYQFTWNIYCDWYLELIKPVLTGPDSPTKTETRASAAWVLSEILKLLHPFMPFVTEELWQITAQRDSVLALTKWPVLADQHKGVGLLSLVRRGAKAIGRGAKKVRQLVRDRRIVSGDSPAAVEVRFIIGLVEAVRSARVEFEIQPSSYSLVRAINYNSDHMNLIHRYRNEIVRLSRSLVDPFKSELVTSDDPDVPREIVEAARTQVALAHAVLPYEEGQLLLHAVDLQRQKSKYETEIKRLDADLARVNAKLGNSDFLKRAPEEVVEGEREKRAEAEKRKAKLAEALQRLEGAV
jgi:valyl-tRNA synthetase